VVVAEASVRLPGVASGAPGISFGPVTGFGSVFVNGTAFDTNDAVILVNGEPATEASLTEGMLVRVEGEWTGTGTGTADRMEYRNDIRGPVQAKEVRLTHRGRHADRARPDRPLQQADGVPRHHAGGHCRR
jgi:hypothetical protein